jgi:zinc-ribbon domain
MRCPSCHAQNPPSASSCTECGAVLPGTSEKEPAHNYPIAQAQVDDEEILDVVPATRRRQRKRDEDDDEFDNSGDGGISTLIPYRNPKALAAYYFGFFSLIPAVGLAAAPFAVILGILGIKTARANPEAKGIVHACIGVVFGTISLLCNPGWLYFYFFTSMRD